MYFFLEHRPILVYFSKLALDTTLLPKDLKKYTVYFSIMALGTPYFNKKVRKSVVFATKKHLLGHFDRNLLHSLIN